MALGRTWEGGNVWSTAVWTFFHSACGRTKERQRGKHVRADDGRNPTTETLLLLLLGRDRDYFPVEKQNKVFCL